MANKGKRMLFEEDYEYLQKVIKNNPDPSDIGGGNKYVTIPSSSIGTALSDEDFDNLVNKGYDIILDDGDQVTSIYYRNYEDSNEIQFVQSELGNYNDGNAAKILLYQLEVNKTTKVLNMNNDSETVIKANVTVESGDTTVPLTNLQLCGYGDIYTIQGGSTYTAGTGIDITSDTISVDNTVALKTDIPTLYLHNISISESYYSWQLKKFRINIISTDPNPINTAAKLQTFIETNYNSELTFNTDGIYTRQSYFTTDPDTQEQQLVLEWGNVSSVKIYKNSSTNIWYIGTYLDYVTTNIVTGVSSISTSAYNSEQFYHYTIGDKVLQIK